MRRITLAAAALALAAGPLYAQSAKDPASTRDAEIRKAIAVTWEKLAAWCLQWKLRPEARAAADEALALDPGNARAKSAREAADREGSEPAEASRKEYAKKLEATKKQAAGLWRQLAQEAKDPAAADADTIAIPPDASAAAAQTAPPGADGCGCALSRAPAHRTLAWTGLLLLALPLRARRWSRT